MQKWQKKRVALVSKRRARHKGDRKRLRMLVGVVGGKIAGK